MGQYRVVGADRETGVDREIVVEAESELHAGTVANNRGVLPTDITVMSGASSRVKGSARRTGQQRHDDRAERKDAQMVRIVLDTDSVIKLGIGVGIGIALSTVLTIILWVAIGAAFAA